MAGQTVFLVCTLVIFFYVDTSTAAVSGGTCSKTSEARQTTCESITNAECVSSTCQCKTGSTPNNDNDQCFLALEGNCSTGLVCTTENAECTSGKCACKSDYKPNTGNTACEKKGLTDTCSNDADCQNIPNAVCSSTTCSCGDGYKADDNGACLLIPVTDIDCSTTGDADCPENAVCVDEQTCQCEVGFKEDGNQCSDAASTAVMMGMVFSSVLALLTNTLFV